MAAAPVYQRIYAVVRRVPRGKVATYGQIARLARLPGRARQVGYARRFAPAEFGWKACDGIPRGTG